jgi:hypothetical protein
MKTILFGRDGREAADAKRRNPRDARNGRAMQEELLRRKWRRVRGVFIGFSFRMG